MHRVAARVDVAKAKRGAGGRFKKAARSAGRRTRRAAGRVYRGARRFARAARGRSLGLLGKTGVGIVGGAPIAGSAIAAGSRAAGLFQTGKFGIMASLHYGFWSFLNNMSSGFNLGPIKGAVSLDHTDGSNSLEPLPVDVPAGAWFKTTVIGGTLIAYDLAVSFLSRKLAKVNSGVRFMGMKLTGGK